MNDIARMENTMIIKLITLALMASFYACYFAKMMSQRRQGIATDQLGKGKQGFTKFIELALKVTTYVLPIIQIISILLYAGTLHILVRIAGIMLTAVGVIVFVISVAQMKDNWRAGVQREEKTNLVTTGIYSVSRNPAFLGLSSNFFLLLNSISAIPSVSMTIFPLTSFACPYAVTYTSGRPNNHPSVSSLSI